LHIMPPSRRWSSLQNERSWCTGNYFATLT
jgi:hypothetical protein